MKRLVRVKLDYTVVIDDDREGIPFIRDEKITDLIVDGLKSVVPAAVAVLPGAKFQMSLTRESLSALRARNKARKAAR
jgi:hypothetical protein